MTPERQAQIATFLSELSSQFTARIAKEDLDELNGRLVDLEASIVEDRDLTFLGMLQDIYAKHGLDAGGAAERFYASCAAMTLATYLSRMDIE